MRQDGRTARSDTQRAKMANAVMTGCAGVRIAIGDLRGRGIAIGRPAKMDGEVCDEMPL